MLKFIIILGLLFSSVFSETERFKIPKDKELLFYEKRQELFEKPYNFDEIKEFISFLKENNIEIYDNESLISALKFSYTTSRSESVKNYLFEIINKPIIENENKEGKNIKDIKKSENLLHAYIQRNFKDTFENLLFYKISNQKDKETLLKTKLESNERSFYPSTAKEIFYKIRYYLSIGDTKEAEDAFSKVEKRLESDARGQKTLRDNKAKELALKAINDRFPKKKVRLIDLDTAYMSYIATLGSFIYEDSNKEHSSNLKALSKDLLDSEKNLFYFYQMHDLHAMFEDYENAIFYLEYINNNDKYTDLSIELLNLYVSTSKKEYEAKHFSMAWLNSKEGIKIGKTLDYKIYAKDIILLKKILKISSVEYAKVLINEGNINKAKSMLDETNNILRVVLDK